MEDKILESINFCIGVGKAMEVKRSSRKDYRLKSEKGKDLNFVFGFFQKMTN